MTMTNEISKLINEIKIYSLEGTEQEFNILPFITIYLYANNKLSIVNFTDINSITNNVSVIAYKNLEEAFLNGDISDSEKIDYNNGIDAYALTLNIDKNDYTDLIISFTLRTTVDILKKKGTYHNVSKAIFKLYRALSTYSFETIKAELHNIFTSLIDFCFLYCTPLQDYYNIRNQKACNDLNQLIMWLLDIGNNGKIQSIYHPMAEASSFVSYGDAETLYQATYADVRYLCLYQMFATISKKKVKLEPSEVGDFNIDKSICDAVIFDNRSIIGRDYRIFWSIVFSIWSSRKEGVVIADTNYLYEINNKKSTHIDWNIIEENISHIIYLPNNIAIIKISNHKKNKNVILIDGTQGINYDEIINDVKNNENIYVLTKEEIEAPDFVFGLNQVLSKRERELYKNNKKGIFVSEILMPSTTIKQKIDGSALNFYDTKYSRFLPYYKVECGKIVCISGQEAKNPYSKHVLIINLVDIEGYQPKIVFYDKEFAISINEYAYDINSDVVDYQYLINEMNKDYFIKQIFPTFNMDYSNINWNNLSKCFIKIPKATDTRTPLERQKILLNSEKKEFINKLLQSYDYNIEEIVAEEITKEKSFLPYGTTLYGSQYMIIQEIGSGGFGKTYKARYIGEDCKSFARTVAIKEFFDNQFQKRATGTTEVISSLNQTKNISKVRNKFFTEAEKIKTFSDCDNIIKVYDVFEENNTSYYSMEYIEGKNLRDYVPRGGALEESEAILIIRQVANALKRMHSEGMLHFDVKPSNIMVSNDGRVVLIDFGAAHRFFGECSEHTLPVNVRSNGYSAPEPIEDANESYDIYSLGATLFYMLGGIDETEKSDCDGDASEKDLQPPLIPMSDEVRLCIEKAMQYNKNDRQQSIDEFLAMLPS